MPASHARSIVQRVVVALMIAAALGAAHASRAATPETITLTPASLPATWQTPLLVGANALDRSTCVENTSCDTVRIVLAAGDWRGKQISVSIDCMTKSSASSCWSSKGTRSVTKRASRSATGRRLTRW